MKKIVSCTLSEHTLGLLDDIVKTQSCSRSQSIEYAIRAYHTLLFDDGTLKL